MRLKWVIVLAVLLSAAALSACGGPPPPTCDVSDLVAPILMMPADGGLLELGQNLDWEYPASPCEPGGYNLQVNTASDFSGTEVGGFVPPPHSWWWPTTQLEQGTTYYWRVHAVLDGDVGPWSPTWSFNTKPACTLAELVAPNLIFPADNAEIIAPLPAVVWEYSDPACDPLGYHLQIATDPGFDFTTIAYERRSPDTTTEDSAAGTTLANCDTYYWRVAGYDGITDGPFSPTRSFFLNLGGTCILPPFEPPHLELEAFRDWPCYERPSFEAAILGYFLTGEIAPLIAQDLLGEWWVIENPDAVGESCWVPREGTEPSGDTEDLQRLDGSEPSPMCTRDLDRATCEAAGGTYVEPSRVANDDYCQCP